MSEEPAVGGREPDAVLRHGIRPRLLGLGLRGRLVPVAVAAMASVALGAAGAVVGLRGHGDGGAAAGSVPVGRTGAALAYDPDHHVTILFGGQDATGATLADTWAWDGSGWTRLAPPVAPPPRSGAAMAWSAEAHAVVLFGGVAAGPRGVPVPAIACAPESACPPIGGFGLLGDTWTWDGATWTREHTAHHPAGIAVGMADDPATHQLVLVGQGRLGLLAGDGATSLTSALQPGASDTFGWDGTDWRVLTALPSVDRAIRIVSDPQNGRPAVLAERLTCQPVSACAACPTVAVTGDAPAVACLACPPVPAASDAAKPPCAAAGAASGAATRPNPGVTAPALPPSCQPSVSCPIGGPLQPLPTPSCPPGVSCPIGGPLAPVPAPTCPPGASCPIAAPRVTPTLDVLRFDGSWHATATTGGTDPLVLAATDPRSHTVVGLGPAADGTASTRVLRGSSWTPAHGVAPASLEGAALAETPDGPLLFGGAGWGSGTAAADATYLWDGSAWVLRSGTAASPPPKPGTGSGGIPPVPVGKGAATGVPGAAPGAAATAMSVAASAR